MTLQISLARTSLVLAGAAAALALSAGTADASGVADLAGGALYNTDHAIYVVKDLGGGAYWNVTTTSLYVVDTGSQTAVDTLVTGATAGGEELAQAVGDGRDALLLVNGTVLVPVEALLTR